MLKLVTPLTVVFLVALVFILLIYARATNENQRLLEMEAAKSLLQVMAVAVIGNIVLVFVRAFEERRKDWIARRDLLHARRDLLRKDLSEGLDALYLRTKQIRRLLRAITDPVKMDLPQEQYSELLEDLSEIQLSLEKHSLAARIGGPVVGLPDSVSENLRKMERYIGLLVTEYESSYSAGQHVHLEKLVALRNFTKPARIDFKQNFSAPYHQASTDIAKAKEADLFAEKSLAL
ncbi:hypothetical protein WL49_15570 [Burkholderia ubonensis]|nr:hypothetical protein WL49_15570 [Burkholderia ubonensis]